MHQSRNATTLRVTSVLALLCLFTLPAQAKYSGGTGDPNDPHQIATPADLIALGNEPNDYAKHFILTADIDLDPNLPGNHVFDRAVIVSDVNDTTGTFDGPGFTGVFDGQNHAIRGLVIDSNVPHAGLFGLIGTGGCVRNLNLVGGSVGLQRQATDKGGRNRGALAGENRGWVTACSSSVSVDGLDTVGGLVGFNHEGTILACYTTGIVAGGTYSTGGLVGQNFGGTISACYSTGPVDGESIIGSLVGYNNGTISDCYSTGEVNGSKAGSFVGGLAGSNAGTISGCHSTGSVNGAGSTIGGLVGNNDKGIISVCYSTGPVRGAGSDIGGLVGCNYGAISACYSTSVVNGAEGRDIGGLIGSNWAGTISVCCSTGSVRGGESVGGLVGVAYNQAPIVACYSAGKVVGTGSDIGGLIGREYGGAISACFWDVQTSGQTTSAGGTGLTTFQMMAVQTFLDAGWDFSGEKANGLCEYWQMPAGGGYPELRIPDDKFSHALQGEGTAESPYLLETAGDLGAVWRHPTTCYQLAADLDLSGIKWGLAVIPVFRGRLDGQSHRVRGMDISGAAYLGLVGLAQGAVVTRLCLEDVNVVGTDRFVGGLVGYKHYGTISSCRVTGSVLGVGQAGGLVGVNNGDVFTCCSSGSVAAWYYSGGLVGENYGFISDCYSMSSVGGVTCLGGLVGADHYGLILTCYSTGPVKGTKGFVGYNESGPIIDCFWDVQTSGQTSSAGGTGKTTTQMQTAKTFLDAGWDFAGETANGTDDIWWIDEGKDYPRLWWERSDGALQF